MDLLYFIHGFFSILFVENQLIFLTSVFVLILIVAMALLLGVVLIRRGENE